MKQLHLYRCFSWRLKDFLTIHGFKYEFKAQDIYTKKIFYCYRMSNDLDICLKEYSKLKKEYLDNKLK